MDWWPQILQWLQHLFDIAGAIITISSAITIMAAAIGFVAKRIIKYGEFGPPPPPVGPRQQKFFQSLVKRVRKRDKQLISPAAVGVGPGCIFQTNMPGIAYHIHFTNGTFRVYMNMSGVDGESLYEELQKQETELRNKLGLKRHPDEPLVWEEPHGALGYCAIVNYPGGGAVSDEPKKLRRMRKWGIKRLIKFHTVFDPRVAAIRGGIRTPQSVA